MSRFLTVALLLLLLLAATVALASHGGYHLDWWTVDGGGGRLTTAGSTYSLKGTVGQPDAGLLETADGAYALRGGYWDSSAPSGGDPPAPSDTLYLPILQRGS